MIASATDAAPGASPHGPSSFAALLQQQSAAPAATQAQTASQPVETKTAAKTSVQAQRVDERRAAERRTDAARARSHNADDQNSDHHAAARAGEAAPDAANPATHQAQADGAHGIDAGHTTAQTDPLNAWMAMLQGCAQAISHPSADAGNAAATQATDGADLTLQALGTAADRGQLELQGNDGSRLATAGRQRDETHGEALAATLAGAGRAGDAASDASATALGLSAVRMLGDGHDGTTGGAALVALPQAGSPQAAAPADAATLSALGALSGLAAAGGSANVATRDLPRVQTPVGAAGFADELADRVQVFVSKAALESAAGGVHEARLNLNPVEMGPVAIRIVLDGQQAQVDFAAASGATRAALQDSLPALASALDSAGLTLTGGGVSQEFAQTAREQAWREQAGHAASSSGRAASHADAEPDASRDAAMLDASASAGQWLQHPEGRLDLYA